VSPTRSAIRHVGLAGALVVVIWWLWDVGHGPLAGPSPSIDDIRAWIERNDAVTLALSITRLEALACATYLLAVTMVSGAARWLSLPRVTRIVERLTPHLLRGFLGGIATLGVMAAPPPTSIPAPTATATPATTTPNDAPATATLHVITDAVEPVTPPPAPDAQHDSWVVRPGDNLWLIAREQVVDETGEPVSDETIATYWHRLIEVNRDLLADPNEPDLIFAGQVLELPAVDAG
jgi:nucleoid-associated protein YgaU